MTSLTMSRTSGLPDAEQSEPFDETTYRHHWALLKSMHCARPVLHRGMRRFISCLTVNGTGTQLDMLVYLAGSSTAISSMEIEIMENPTGGSDA